MSNNKLITLLSTCVLTLIASPAFPQSPVPFYDEEINQCTIQSNTIIDGGAYRLTRDLWEDHQHETGIYGHTWIGPYAKDPSHKNGSRDTIIFIPSQFNYEAVPDIVFWLHGHWGFNKFSTRLLRHIPELYARGQNTIIIAVEQPWSAWTTTPTSRNGTGPFRQPGDIEEYLELVFEKLLEFGIPPENILSNKITLYGHSAGGSGILSMARSGALDILSPGRIVFSDSTYGRWFEGFYTNYYRDNPDTEVIVLAKENSPTSQSMNYFLSRNRPVRDIPTFWYSVLSGYQWTHKRIGDNCILYPGNPFSP